MRNFFSTFILLSSSILIFIVYSGCEGESANNINKIDSAAVAEYEAGKLISFNGRLFSMPSPVQAAELIKNVNLSYNKDLLNPTHNKSKYTSSLKQSLNLGVYGADLAYTNIYEVFTQAALYFSAVKSLSKELNILNSFTENIIHDIERNSTNKDSLIRITTEAYRNADKYLIENERNDIAVLVIAGGWIESLYIMTQVVKEKTDEDLIIRIGEQKHPLNNLIELLKPYYSQKSDKFDKLLEDLADLALVYDGVVIEYTFKKPEIFPQKKLSIIKSEAKTVINDYQLKTISEKIGNIRNRIIE